MADEADEGLTLFARMAHPPNERGYCGPAEHGALLDHARGLPLDARMRDLAADFDGPLPYLRAIANGGDPFAAPVVEAYWLGSDLLDAVDADVLAAELDSAFRGQPTVEWGRVRLALAEPLAHHTWHVLVTYPWLPLLAHPAGHALEVLDRCRVRVGHVLAHDGDGLVVAADHLAWDGRTLRIEVQEERVGDVVDDDPPAVGEWIALHWDWVCAVVNAAQVAAVRRAEARSITAVNRLLLSCD